MLIIMNVWLAFNIVFGIWSAKNWMLWVYAVFSKVTYKQSTHGQMLDMVVLTSIIAYLLTFGA